MTPAYLVAGSGIATANAWLKSATMSAIASIPTETYRQMSASDDTESIMSTNPNEIRSDSRRELLLGGELLMGRGGGMDDECLRITYTNVLPLLTAK